MKPILLILILFVLVTGCRKAKCKKATITLPGMPCALWGIKVDSETYPADSIPLGFRREGEVVCVDYQLYQDMRVCACCGGTWAKIVSIRWPDE